MALTKIKAGSIADGAVTSAKLAAGAGGVPSESVSATPTLSSSVVNKIVIGNYSSYASPTFNTKVGSTNIPNTDNAGTLTLAAPFSLGGTQTVSVEAVYAGKLHSTAATVSVVLPSLTARYWRITNQVFAGPTSQPPVYYVWQLFPSLNGGGTKRGSVSALSASFNGSGRVLGNLYTGTGTFSWYPIGFTGSAADLWAQYDLGTPQEVLSMQWSGYTSTTSYFATSFTLQNSNDGTNWVDIKDVTQTAGGSQLRTIDL